MAAFNFNKVIIGGRLTADPELRTTPSGVSVVNFTVAVNRRFNKDEESVADFFNLTAWRQTAEFICKYFRKGSSISIVGRLQSKSWTNQEGEKHYSVGIEVDEVGFVDSKNEAPATVQQAASAPAPAPMPNYTGESAPRFEAVADDEDLPF